MPLKHLNDENFVKYLATGAYFGGIMHAIGTNTIASCSSQHAKYVMIKNFRHNWLNLASGTTIFIIKRRSAGRVPAVEAAGTSGQIIIILFLSSSLLSGVPGVDYHFGRSLSIHFSSKTFSSHQRAPSRDQRSLSSHQRILSSA